LPAYWGQVAGGLRGWARCRPGGSFTTRQRWGSEAATLAKVVLESGARNVLFCRTGSTKCEDGECRNSGAPARACALAPTVVRAGRTVEISRFTANIEMKLIAVAAAGAVSM